MPTVRKQSLYQDQDLLQVWLGLSFKHSRCCSTEGKDRQDYILGHVSQADCGSDL